MGGSKISFPSVNELQRKRATNHRQSTDWQFLRPPFCCSFPLQFISKRGVGIPSVNTRFSLVPPSPRPFLKWVAKEKSNKRGAEKKWVAKKEQQILMEICLSPGRETDHTWSYHRKIQNAQSISHKVTISIDPHRKTPTNRWILLQKCAKYHRQKMMCKIFQSKNFVGEEWNYPKSGPTTWSYLIILSFSRT